eukprot:Amastigsp_a677886_7.p2 type:complete len:167 gc:universal Amastigsp_a677886_7:654-154(-)
MTRSHEIPHNGSRERERMRVRRLVCGRKMKRERSAVVVRVQCEQHVAANFLVARKVLGEIGLERVESLCAKRFRRERAIERYEAERENNTDSESPSKARPGPAAAARQRFRRDCLLRRRLRLCDRRGCRRGMRSLQRRTRVYPRRGARPTTLRRVRQSPRLKMLNL